MTMSDLPTIERHRTALTRYDLSRPMRAALDAGLISQETTVLDYGCGCGGDIKRLNGKGIPCIGWDPIHAPNEILKPSDIVNLGYVVNVIEDPTERAETLRQAWSYAKSVLVVSAQLGSDAKPGKVRPFSDGILTSTGTFQKYFEQHELREWIESKLNTQTVAAAPGIFYVFRDPKQHQEYLAAQYRRHGRIPDQRRCDALYEEHRELLTSLVEFVAERGRIPNTTEVGNGSEIVEKLGSIKRAFHIVRLVTGKESWEEIHDERAEDLLIYLALANFDGRPRFSELSSTIQRDVRAFFSTYKRGCEEADRLLRMVGDRELIDVACRYARVGKLTPSALYIHISAIETLPTILRIYEGCARGLVGQVEGANIIKLSRESPKVSYLSYPGFDEDPHPALAWSYVVPLDTFRAKFRDYTESKNPPILHRKEEFVDSDYPSKEEFRLLTLVEEEHGLLQDTQSIGYRIHWQDYLSRKGYTLCGHELVKVK